MASFPSRFLFEICFLSLKNDGGSLFFEVKKVFDSLLRVSKRYSKVVFCFSFLLNVFSLNYFSPNSLPFYFFNELIKPSKLF